MFHGCLVEDMINLRPKIGFDVGTDDATQKPRWYEKLYYSHDGTF